MQARSRFVVSTLALGGLVVLCSQRLLEDRTTTVAVVAEHDMPSTAVAAGPKRGPTAAVFAARVEGFLPLLEQHVAAGSAKSHEASADCAFDASYRLTDIDSIERSLLDGGNYGAWADVEARSLAASVADSLGPLRQCVACGPRGGCGAAARVLVRLENSLVAYRARADRSGT